MNDDIQARRLNNIRNLSEFYGVPFRYNDDKQRYEGFSPNNKVLLSVGTIGQESLFGFSGPDELMPREN